MRYGERIKQLRKARGMSAEDLAEATGISPATIYRYENGSTGEPKSSMLRKIANTLNVDVWQIIGFDSVNMDDINNAEEQDDDPWALREELRRDPDRKALLKLARNGSAQDVRQAMALIDALRATNPDFYDGDDPA